MSEIMIARDFSKTPSGRVPDDGPANGQLFREKILKPALKEGGRVIVILDGAAGYPSSFLEEAFGGLVRHKYFTESELKKILEIVANDSSYKIYKLAVWRYISEAQQKLNEAR